MIVLVGKTCSGKTVIRDALAELGVEKLISYTTRPMRNGEKDGVTYHYVSKSEFIIKQNEGFFFETSSYKVAYGQTWYYGTAFEDLSDDKVAIVNPEGLKKIKAIKNIIPIVFYITASDEVLKVRLLDRGDNPREAKRRLNADNKDFENIEYDCLIDNDSYLFTPMELAKIILDEYEKRRKV